MDELQKLYGVLVREGKYTKSFDEFKNKWSSDTDYQNQVFDVVSRDGLYTKDKQSFFEKYSGAAPVFQEQVSVQPQVKKKEPTMASKLGATSSESQRPTSQKQELLGLEQLQKIASEPIVSKRDAIPSKPQVVTSTPSQALRAEEATKPIATTPTYESERQRPTSRIEVAPVKLEKPITLAEFNRNIKEKEAQDRLNRKPEDQYFTGEFGDVLNNIPILGEVIDDFGRSVNIGVNNGDIVMPTSMVMTNGKKASSEEINKYIEVTKKAQSFTPSDEMQDFSKIYQEGGSSIFSFLKGLATHPSIAPELVISSFAGLFNPASAAAAGTVVGGAAAYGALATPEFGGVGALPAAAASIPYAMGAANTLIETSLTFSELLQDELKKRNLDFTENNIRTILEDDKTLNSIRNKSISRGVTIGAIDALTGRVAGKVGANLIGNTSASRIKAGLAAGGIESGGGMLGEAAGRAVAGQEMDVAEIGLEGIAEGPTAVISVASELMQRPTYKVNGEVTTESNVKNIIDTATPEELSKINIDIKNDKKGYSAQIQDKVLTHQIQQEVKQVNPNLDEESINQITDLEKQLQGLENNKTQVAKDKASDIKSQIKTIQENAIQKQTTDESVLRTEQPQVGLQEVGEGDQVNEVVTEEVKPKEEVVTTQVNVSPYFNTKIETIEDAEKLRSNEGYKKHKDNLLTLAKDLGIKNAKVDDVIGGYYNEETKEDFIEISNVVTLEDATIDQAEIFAALAAVTSPEVQQATIAAQYTDKGSGTHNANEYTIKVSDVNGAMKSLKEAGISDFTVNEKNGTISFIDILEFEDAEFERRITKFVDSLDNKGISYEESEYRPIESRYVDKGKRKEILTGIKSERTNARQGGENLYTKIDEAIARDAEFNGIPIDEYLGITKTRTAEQEVADLETLLRENRFSSGYNEKYKKNAAQIENQRRLAELARKSLAKIAPDVKIILHETAEEYDNAVPKPSQGAFLFDDNTIHINLQYAGVETIPHEVFHAILAIKIKTDPRATQVTKEMMDSVMKVLDTDSPVYKQMEKLASNYEESLQDEESLAELFGILSVNYEKLPVPAKNAIIAFIEKIANLFGLDITNLIGRTDNSVINLLNTLSEKVAKGQEIQEGEIAILGAGGDGTRTPMFKTIQFTKKDGTKIDVDLDNITLDAPIVDEFEKNKLYSFGIMSGDNKLGDIMVTAKGDDVQVGVSAIYKNLDPNYEKPFFDKVFDLLKNVFVKPFKKVVITDSPNRGKGIGKVAYGILANTLKEKYGKKLVSDTIRSDAAEGLWSSLEKQGLAKVIGDKNGPKTEYYYEYVVPTTQSSRLRETSANNINNIIKLARANGFSEEAISTVLTNRGFAEEEITDALATELGAKGTVEVTEELLPGREELLKKVDAMIKRQQSKDVAKGKIAQNVKKLMEKSDAYNNATDIQKEKLIRDANKKIGIREKNAPSIKALKQGVETVIERGVSAFDRFFGAIEPEKKITMTEKQAFAEAMKNADRGGKDAKKKWMAISNELTKQIKKLADSGKITVKQSAAVLRKFSGVNVFDNASIDRFVEYMSKVFENAEYAEKISNAFAKLPTAKKNAKTKLGIAESLTPALNRMLSIKPTLIPDSVLDSYLDIVDMIGAKSEVLTLEEINSLTKRVNDILDAVDAEVSKADELAERFNEYDGKVIDEDGKLDYSATIKAMLKDNTISEDEAEIMRKYKSSIVEPVERVKKTEEELAAEKEELISAVESLDVDTETLPTRDERDLAKELASLIKTDAIKELSNNQLKNLFKTIDNINNGYLPHYAQLMVEKLNAINNAKTLSSGIQNASPLSFSKLYANLKSIITRKGSILEMIRRNPLAVIDQVFGNFKDKPIFNSLFEKSAEAETKYKSDVTKVQQKLSDAQEAVAKSFNNDANKTLMSSFKMMTYMIQLEHDSNIDSKQVNQASDYLKATIKHIDEGKSEFGERDANMLQDIVDKYTNEEGQIDIDKLYKSFNTAEKNAIKTVRNINESLTEKAVYTASIIRGDKIAPLNNYVHLNVLHESLPQDNIAGVSSMEQYNQSIMPSSKAKSLIERTGKVSPLNFDIFTSANRGANFVLMDYHLTEPIRTARKTINETTAMLEKDGRMSKKDRELLNAVKDAYEEVVSNVLTNNFINTSIADDVMDFMTRQGYRAVLASAPRFVSELSSNISYALLAEPKAFQKGIELRGVAMSPNAVDIMNNVDSKQTTRIFHGDTLSGRLIDTSTLNQVSGVRGGKGKSDVANKTQQIYNNSLKKYKNFVELTADALISTPDKMVMRPIWFGSFANEFENVTGSKPDFDKIAANDEAYMSENKEAIDKARNSADDKTVRAGATENAFMGILKGTVKPNQSALLRGFNTFNNFMTKFMIYEYVTARAGINAAMGNGSVSRKQGVALIAGVTSRMLVYSIMTQMLGSAMVGLITGDDDEEDDKTFLQKIGQYITSTATGLILGRDYGNATKSMINFGVEKMNEKYLDFLREGEYDPYQDAIQYTVLPTDSKKSQTDLGDLLMKVGGALGPSMKTADLIIKKATGEPKQEAEAIERSDREIKQRIPLEVLGNTGFIPLYKDVRKILMSDMYKELRQTKGPTKKDAEQELLQGYDTREDMKRYDPALYEQTFGKGSPTYEVDKMIKDMEKQEKDMEQKIKDMTYGYTGETKKKK